MIINCFQNFLVYCYRITATEVVDPGFLKHVLIVGDYLSTYVGIVLGTFLQLLTIYSIYRIILFDGCINRLSRGCHLEDKTVNGSVVTYLEDSFFFIYIEDAVGIQVLVRGFVVLVDS